MAVRGNEQHDRDVVDGGAVSGRSGTPLEPATTPAEASTIGDRRPRAASARPRGPSIRVPRGMARARPNMPGSTTFSHRTGPGARQPRGMVLVRMRKDHHIDSPVPGRHLLVERLSSSSGSGPPSMSRRPPRPPSTRIASPCPMSSTVTLAFRRAVDDHDGRRDHGAGQGPRDEPPPALAARPCRAAFAERTGHGRGVGRAGGARGRIAPRVRSIVRRNDPPIAATAAPTVSNGSKARRSRTARTRPLERRRP